MKVTWLSAGGAPSGHALPSDARSGVGAEAEKFHGGLGARLDVQFFVDAALVRAHGAEADAELVGDFLVERALREQREDFVFAWAEFLHVGGGLLRLVEML